MSLASAAVGAAEPASGPAASATAETATAGRPARQLFDEGREHYLRGRYAEAVVALEAASGVPRGVTRSARARSVLGALGLPGDAIGPVSAAARERVAFS